MASARYTVSLDEDGSGSITAAQDGRYVTIDSQHPNFKVALDAVFHESTLAELEEILDGEAYRPDHEDIVKLTSRVTLKDGVILLDDKPAPSSLSATITRYRNEGRPFMGLVKFLERLDKNPSRRSREQLFSWTSRADLEVDEEGYLIGYKGVTSELTSVNTSGSAYVDGVLHEGAIPNRVGATISMNREDVQDDPNITCSHGLHVGNEQYAKSFGRTLLIVKVDPADVVSVPTDYSGQKMRCCRYTVLEVIEQVVPDYEPAGATDDPEVIERLSQVIPEKFLAKLLRKARTARVDC